MDITFTHFLTAFSSALDLTQPDNGQSGARRAYIAAHIARHRGLNQRAQRRLFIAALLLNIAEGPHSPAHHVQRLSNIPLLAESAGLICAGSANTAERRLLQLACDLDRLSLNTFPRGHYPEKAMQTLCESIGEKYALDDVIALRDLGLHREFWQELASASLKTQVASLAPYPKYPLERAELLQLSTLLARVIDTHCGSAAGHSFNVAELSGELGRMYGFSPEGIHQIRIAGLLHDLGKLALPVSLLRQKAPLSENQKRQIQRHPLHTWEILTAVSGMRDIAQMASFHHERLDGKGYPFYLRSTQLDLGPRIIAVADNFSALTEARDYKSAFSAEKSLRIMRENARSGGLDADVIGALESCLAAGNALNASSFLP